MSDFVLKQGATGSVISTTLSDSSGAIDLTGFASVAITAQRGTNTPVIDAAACTVADAVNGVVEFEFDVTTAAIPVGEYDFEFTAVDGDGEIYKFPTNKRRPYAKLIVLRALG